MTYKTKTTIQGEWVEIKVYRNGLYWHTYDFLIDKSEMMLMTHLPTKVWGTMSNLIEIRESISKHINLN